MTTTLAPRSAGTLNPTRQQLDELDALLQRMLDLPVSKLDEPEPPVETDPLTALRDSLQPTSDEEPHAETVSYVSVETASPRPLPPASGFEPQPTGLTPRLVPVSPQEEPNAPEQTEAFAPIPEPEPQTMQAPEATFGDDEAWVPLRSTWKPSPQTWPPLVDSWNQANGVAPPSEFPLESIPLPHLEDAPPPEETPSASETFVANAEAAPPSDAPRPAIVEPRLSLTAEDAPVSVAIPLMPLLWFNQGFDTCLAPLGFVGRGLSGPRGRQILGFVGLASLAAAAALGICAWMGWT